MEEPPSETKKFVQGQQAKFAQQALQSLWPRPQYRTNSHRIRIWIRRFRMFGPEKVNVIGVSVR
jgi:hypothetical protein